MKPLAMVATSIPVVPNMAKPPIAETNIMPKYGRPVGEGHARFRANFAGGEAADQHPAEEEQADPRPHFRPGAPQDEQQHGEDDAEDRGAIGDNLLRIVQPGLRLPEDVPEDLHQVAAGGEDGQHGEGDERADGLLPLPGIAGNAVEVEHFAEHRQQLEEQEGRPRWRRGYPFPPAA